MESKWSNERKMMETKYGNEIYWIFLDPFPLEQSITLEYLRSNIKPDMFGKLIILIQFFFGIEFLNSNLFNVSLEKMGCTFPTSDSTLAPTKSIRVQNWTLKQKYPLTKDNNAGMTFTNQKFAFDDASQTEKRFLSITFFFQVD